VSQERGIDLSRKGGRGGGETYKDGGGPSREGLRRGRDRREGGKIYTEAKGTWGLRKGGYNHEMSLS